MFCVVIYLLTATPMYTASSRILMDTRQTQIVDKDSGTPSTLIDPGFVDSQVEILNSDDLILSVVRNLEAYQGSGIHRIRQWPDADDHESVVVRTGRQRTFF